MIVKNIQASPQRQQQVIQQKPYFLQGFEYARKLLAELKKQKQSEQNLHYSPINRKHTKFSSDAIIEQESKNQVQFFQSKNYEQNEEGREGKDRKKRTQKQQPVKKKENNYIQEKEGTIRKNQRGGALKKNKKIRTQSLDDNNDSSMKKNLYKMSQNQDTSMVVYQQYEDHENNINKSTNIQNISQIMNQKSIPSPFHSSLHQQQTKINKIGLALQQLNSQIQTYETIFDNLCDCYRANQHINTKNQKLRKQAIRLEEEKAQILGKIGILGMEIRKFQKEEKTVNDFIGTKVEEYVRGTVGFNREIQVQAVQIEAVDEQLVQSQKQQSEGQEFNKNLNLNFKKMKQKYDVKSKKKLNQQKKLQKGVSFEQQIDVIAKYYENQLTSI